jgi:hypothetical protein
VEVECTRQQSSKRLIVGQMANDRSDRKQSKVLHVVAKKFTKNQIHRFPKPLKRRQLVRGYLEGSLVIII